MKIYQDERGFRSIYHKPYPKGPKARIVKESSAVGEYADAVTHPGSSFLWLGNDFHLNREEVATLIVILKLWLEEKRLPVWVLGGKCDEEGT